MQYKNIFCITAYIFSASLSMHADFDFDPAEPVTINAERTKETENVFNTEKSDGFFSDNYGKPILAKEPNKQVQQTTERPSFFKRIQDNWTSIKNALFFRSAEIKEIGTSQQDLNLEAELNELGRIEKAKNFKNVGNITDLAMYIRHKINPDYVQNKINIIASNPMNHYSGEAIKSSPAISKESKSALSKALETERNKIAQKNKYEEATTVLLMDLKTKREPSEVAKNYLQTDDINNQQELQEIANRFVARATNAKIQEIESREAKQLTDSDKIKIMNDYIVRINKILPEKFKAIIDYSNPKKLYVSVLLRQPSTVTETPTKNLPLRAKQANVLGLFAQEFNAAKYSQLPKNDPKVIQAKNGAQSQLRKKISP